MDNDINNSPVAIKFKEIMAMRSQKVKQNICEYIAYMETGGWGGREKGLVIDYNCQEPADWIYEKEGEYPNKSTACKAHRLVCGFWLKTNKARKINYEK